MPTLSNFSLRPKLLHHVVTVWSAGFPIPGTPVVLVPIFARSANITATVHGVNGSTAVAVTNPEREMVTCVPAAPLVSEIPVMTGKLS